MQHEEMTINGILHFRYNPEGQWIAYSPEALTIMLNGATARIAALKAFINDVRPSQDDLKGVQLFSGNAGKDDADYNLLNDDK